MDEGINEIKKNDTWELVSLLKDHKVILWNEFTKPRRMQEENPKDTSQD